MCDEQRSAGDSPEENQSCNIIVSREKETHMCEGPHGVKHSVEKEWCTLCDEAGCDDVYDVRGRCDEAGAHHRDTAHIFTRAEPETAPGR